MLENCISIHSGAVAYSNAYFGSSSGPYHFDDVSCSGSESSLLSCSRGYSIGVHNCRPGKAAGVKCATGNYVVPLCTLHGCISIDYEQARCQ